MMAKIYIYISGLTKISFETQDEGKKQNKTVGISKLKRAEISLMDLLLFRQGNYYYFFFM